MNNESFLKIELTNLRIEFDGLTSPTKLIVPLIFYPGKHRDISIRIQPRKGIYFSNTVEVGDAFKSTFSRSHSGSLGVSFFGTSVVTTLFGQTKNIYEVVSLPDFSGVLFRLFQYTVDNEPIGVQLAFPISSYESMSKEEYFAKITLEIYDQVTQSVYVTQETHPNAGQVLILGANSLIAGESSPLLTSNINLGPMIKIHRLPSFSNEELKSNMLRNFQGIHLFATGAGSKIWSHNFSIASDELFDILSGNGITISDIDN